MARLEGVTRPGPSLVAVIFGAVRRRLGRVPRPLRIHALAPRLLRGYVGMEAAQEKLAAVPRDLKKLAQVRAALRIGCPF